MLLNSDNELMGLCHLTGWRIACIKLIVLLLGATAEVCLVTWEAAAKNWTSKGPQGGDIMALAIDPWTPTIMYAGTFGGGVFKTSNGGANWSTAIGGPDGLVVGVLAIDPQTPTTLYAAGVAVWDPGIGGLFKSTEGGNTWSRVGNGLDYRCIHNLAIDPKTPTTVYAGTCQGLFKSSDGGLNWGAVNNGLGSINVAAFAIDPKVPGNLYVGTDGGVFKSSNGGNSWGTVNSGLANTNVEILAIDPQTPSTAYAIAGGVIFRSSNSGGNWGEVSFGLPGTSITALAMDAQTSGTLYAGTRDGAIFKTINGGASWTATGSLLTSWTVRAVVVDPQDPSTLYAGTAGSGVYKTTNGGTSWSPIMKGLTNSCMRALAVDPRDFTKVYASTSGLESGFYKASNIAEILKPVESWIWVPIVGALAIDPQNPDTVYAGTDGHGVIKSIDGGASWSQVSNGLAIPHVISLAIDPKNPATVYAGTPDGGLFKTTNGGASWTASNRGLLSVETYVLAIDPQNPGTIYAGTAGLGIFRSVDAGANWSAVNAGILPPPDGSYVYALAVDPINPSTVYSGIVGAGVFKSTNGGANWRASNNGLTNLRVRVLAIDPQSPTTLYAGTWGGGIFKSTDGSTTWASFNDGLPNLDVRTLVIHPRDPGIVYAGTCGNGVLVTAAVSQIPLTLSAGGAVSTVTIGSTGESGAIQAGYAALTVNSGSAPYGTAVFGFKQNGVTVSEVGVPASPPTTSARIFIDYRSAVPAVPARTDAGTVDINTGIALVNRGSATANITYTLRDIAGANLSTGHGTLDTGYHRALFIDQLKDIAPDFSLPPDYQSAVQFASLEISGDQPLSILALRLTVNQRHEVLLTTTPVADLAQPLTNSPIYFPQFLDGGGYTTSLILLNTSNTVETGILQVLDDDGAPFVVTQVGGTTGHSFRYSIPSRGTLRFQTDGSAADVKVGWVQLTPDAETSTPIGSGVFSYNPQSVLVTDSGIPAAAATTHARIYVDLSANHNTGLAIANVTDANAHVTINAYQNDGITGIGTSQGPLPLLSRGHGAKFANEFVSGLPSGFKGVLDISSPTPFAALTLRSLYNERDEFLITTFPVADADQAAPSPVVFPRIVDGGGYVTQFILISPGGVSIATLNLHSETGTPLAVGK